MPFTLRANSNANVKVTTTNDVIPSVAYQNRVQALYNAVVGTSGQVNSGAATHTSLQSAINDASTGWSILVLSGTLVENVTVNKQVSIFGQGRASYLNGTMTYTSAGSYSLCKWLKVGNTVTFNVGANCIYFSENWVSTGVAVTDNGTANSKLYIEE